MTTGDDVTIALKKPQVRPALAEAVRLIVTEGYSQADAARAVKMQPHSVQVALKKPHVVRYMADVKRAWLESRTAKSWVNVAELADRAASEDVRLKANRVFLEAAGELGGRGSGDDSAAKTLVQIVLNQAQNTGQPPSQQMPGVIEAPAYQVLTPNASNSDAVGRADSDEETG